MVTLVDVFIGAILVYFGYRIRAKKRRSLPLYVLGGFFVLVGLSSLAPKTDPQASTSTSAPQASPIKAVAKGVTLSPPELQNVKTIQSAWDTLDSDLTSMHNSSYSMPSVASFTGDLANDLSLVPVASYGPALYKALTQNFNAAVNEYSAAFINFSSGSVDKTALASANSAFRATAIDLHMLQSN